TAAGWRSRSPTARCGFTKWGRRRRKRGSNEALSSEGIERGGRRVTRGEGCLPLRLSRRLRQRQGGSVWTVQRHPAARVPFETRAILRLRPTRERSRPDVVLLRHSPGIYERIDLHDEHEHAFVS